MDYQGIKVYFEDMSETKSLLYTLWFNRKILNRKDLADWDREVIRDTVYFTFEQLDKHKVPFAVQNKVLDLAEKGLSFGDFVNSLYLN
jgi:hypothetical protein